jgi:hypothetical protein
MNTTIAYRRHRRPRLPPWEQLRARHGVRSQPTPSEDAAGRAFQYLMCSIPWHREGRNHLRDVVKGSNEQLARKAHKYLTLAAVYTERATFEKRRHEKPPTYYDWLVQVAHMRPADARKEDARKRAELAAWAEQERAEESNPAPSVMGSPDCATRTRELAPVGQISAARAARNAFAARVRQRAA